MLNLEKEISLEKGVRVGEVFFAEETSQQRLMTFSHWGLLRMGLQSDGLWDPAPSLLNFIHTWTSLRKLRLTSQVSSRSWFVPGVMSRHPNDYHESWIASLRELTEEESGSSQDRTVLEKPHYQAPGTRAAAGEAEAWAAAFSPRSQRVTDSEWIIYLCFHIHQPKWRVPSSEQNGLPKLIPESVWGKWSMVEK